MNLAFLDKLEAVKPFAEPDAWVAFKAAALAETFGWTLLICALLIRHYHWPGYSFAVPVAGQIHGIFFLAYFGVLIAMYTSLRWSRRKFLAGILVGVPPYGTLVFEQWAARVRQRDQRRALYATSALWTFKRRYGM